MFESARESKVEHEYEGGEEEEQENNEEKEMVQHIKHQN